MTRKTYSASQKNKLVKRAFEMLEGGVRISHVHEELGVPQSTLRRWLVADGYEANKRASATGALPSHDAPITPFNGMTGRVYIVSSCQNNTAVNGQLWNNILAYAQLRDAQIVLAPVYYQKTRHKDDLKFDDALTPHIKEDNFHLAHDLVFAGCMKVTPTAVNPLSGLQSFPPHASSIIPHQRVHMESVARYDASPLFRYTTGSVTVPNTSDTKAGQIAEFHHVSGFLVVEVDDDGCWWVRQVIANEDGSFQDLSVFVSEGDVYRNTSVEALICGDVHVAQANVETVASLFGRGGVAHELTPSHIVLHDVFDGESISRYNRGDVLSKMALSANYRMCLMNEIDALARFMQTVGHEHDEADIHVVPSNHDDRLKSMFNTIDWRNETPENALAYLTIAKGVMEKIVEQQDYNLLEIALNCADVPNNIKFLDYGDSLMIEDVQCGLHGHVGANGGPASITGFARGGQKTFVGHSHSAGIKDGAWQVGTASELKQDYNVRGPSSWSHHSGIIYKGGKRTLVHTHESGRWRGEFWSV